MFATNSDMSLRWLLSLCMQNGPRPKHRCQSLRRITKSQNFTFTQKQAREWPLFVSVHMWLTVGIANSECMLGLTQRTFVNAFPDNEFHFTRQGAASRLHARKITTGSFTAVVHRASWLSSGEKSFHMFTSTQNVPKVKGVFFFSSTTFFCSF